MFNLAFGASIRQITDGTSKTIAMGDASGGPNWLVCRRKTSPAPPNDVTLWTPRCGVGDWAKSSAGEVADATMGWIIGEPNYANYITLLGARSSIYACTIEAMNKSPVTDTSVDLVWYGLEANAMDASATYECKASFNGGRHSVSNYRSDHRGGCNFLMADGSVAFLNESIDIAAYRYRSTIAADDIFND
jgi:prepilin-type processing-associated H-X9-DG protein